MKQELTTRQKQILTAWFMTHSNGLDFTIECDTALVFVAMLNIGAPITLRPDLDIQMEFKNGLLVYKGRNKQILETELLPLFYGEEDDI